MSVTSALFICDGAAAPAKYAGDQSLVRKRLNCRGPQPNLNLRAENLSEAVLARVTARAADLVHIASYVYAADQEVSRGGERDVYGRGWRRRMVLSIPVTEPSFWSHSARRSKVVNVLSFLTEDRWELEFDEAPPEAGQLTLELEKRAIYGEPDCVILLSGGADSLCAAVEAAGLQGRRPLLVSHRPSLVHDARQSALVAELKRRFSHWPFPHVSFWIHRTGSDAAENSQRSRAFLFASLGAAVAAELGIRDVLLADNGVVSTNLPINAQLAGALASRSTHPKFIAGFNALAEVVLPSAPRVVNPLAGRTRSESLEILKQANAAPMLQETVSCSRTRGRPRVQPQCGYCYQCVDRRFGAIAAGLEEHDLAERYGLDVFTQSLPEGEPRTVAESYIRFAREVAKAGAEDLFLTFPQLYDCVPLDDPRASRMAQAVADVLKRHAENVLGVVSAMLGRQTAGIAWDYLPGNSLLRLIAGTSARQPMAESGGANEFRREGKTRVVTFAGVTKPLRDAKGFRYLEYLINAKGREVHVRDLAALEHGGGAPSEASRDQAREAGLRSDGRHEEPLYTDRTEQEITERLQDIREQRLEAQELGNEEKLAQLDDEVAELEEYLRGGRDHRGRRRTFRPEDRKIYDAVRRDIKRSLREITDALPELGRHFGRSLTISWHCCYSPETPVEWLT